MKIIQKGLVILFASFLTTNALAANADQQAAPAQQKAKTMMSKKSSNCHYVKKCGKKHGKKVCKKNKVCKANLKKANS